MSRTLASPRFPGKSARCALAAALLGVVVTASPAAPARAEVILQQDVQIYRQAFAAADKDRHDEALRIAAAAKERLPAKVIRWMKLAAPKGGSFQEIAAFVRENPEWPNQAQLRRMAELAMDEDVSDDQVLAWFRQGAPITTQGFMRYADALMTRGERDRAIKLIRERWVEANFGPGDEQDFLARFREHLRPLDHNARIDRLLWDHQEGAAKRMLPLADEGHDALIEARVALSEGKGNADAAVARVPASLRDDPGLIYERVRYKRRKDDDAGALELLAKAPAQLGRPALWWTERHILARRAIERGDHKTAYRLARNHGQLDGSSLVEAEFLAGWLALRFLDQPSEAFAHFHKLYRAVSAPISRARGAYWCGRAAEALGDKDQARDWYEKAATYGTTFYGQLATKHLGGKAIRLPAEPRVSKEEETAFERRELVRVVRLVAAIQGRDDEMLTPFLRRVSLDSKVPEDYALAARLAREMARPELAIAAAKDAAQNEVYLVQAGYPVIDTDGIREPERALIHSLIRQESTFNPKIVSSAGARGLMQLMPGTAQLVANQLGIKKHNHAKLLSDPQYNIRLGSAYIADMIDRFNGSYVLAVASYNAGPGRVRSWIDTYGDPRTEAIDVVDWIELIPIYETRNYVQRVMEALMVYRARFGADRAELNLDRELRR